MTLAVAETYFIYLQNVVTRSSCKIIPHSKRMLNLENATDELMLSLQRLLAKQQQRKIKQLSLH